MGQKTKLKERLAEIFSVLIKTPLPPATQEPRATLNGINTKKITASYVAVKLLDSEDKNGNDDPEAAWLLSEAT